MHSFNTMFCWKSQKYGFLVRYDFEFCLVKVISDMFWGPHYAQQFKFGCGKFQFMVV